MVIREIFKSPHLLHSTRTIILVKEEYVFPDSYNTKEKYSLV